MHRTQRIIMVVLAAAIVLIAAMWASGLGLGDPATRDSREHPTEQRENSAEREPADIDNLRQAILTAQRSVDDSRWGGEAEDDIRRIKVRWVSFKPAMRALAGTRMWSASDMNQFETAQADAERAAARRDREQAGEALRTMLDIVEENHTSREGPSVDSRLSAP